MKVHICRYLLLTMVLTVLYGCASTPKFLSSEDRDKIRRVALVTVLEDYEPNTLDITHIKKPRTVKNVWWSDVRCYWWGTWRHLL